MNLHTLPSLKLTLAPENRPSPKEISCSNHWFSRANCSFYRVSLTPPALSSWIFWRKKPEDFLECHLGWGHEKALASALFHCIARNIHGSDFDEISSRKLVMLFGVIRWMMICMGISDVKFWRNMSRISTFTLIIQLDVFMSVCKLQQFCLARRRAHYTTHMITRILYIPSSKLYSISPIDVYILTTQRKFGWNTLSPIIMEVDNGCIWKVYNYYWRDPILTSMIMGGRVRHLAKCIWCW